MLLNYFRRFSQQRDIGQLAALSQSTIRHIFFATMRYHHKFTFRECEKTFNSNSAKKPILLVSANLHGPPNWNRTRTLKALRIDNYRFQAAEKLENELNLLKKMSRPGKDLDMCNRLLHSFSSFLSFVIVTPFHPGGSVRIFKRITHL